MMTDFGPDNIGTATMRGVAASVEIGRAHV